MNRSGQSILVRILASVAVFAAVYGATHCVTHSVWNKERIYRTLINGAKPDQEIAAIDLVYYRAQPQLVRALNANSPDTRELALNSLLDMWQHAAGEKAFGYLQIAQKAVAKKDLELALEVLNRVVKKYPDFAEGWNRRGTLYWLLGQFDLSIADGERTLALNPDHFGAWLGVALCHFKRGEFTSARQAVRASLRIHPHNDTALEFLKKCEDMLQRHPPASKPSGVII
ncbi:MAG: tetratricopeptide repeat protein [Verrucomicrobia bacterium]|nr:tetratricopeptide repeat protein [Verrucomicrobiota bacterium]